MKTYMKKITLLTFFAVLFVTAIQAQCPTSNRANTHVVKSGQTLYSIAKMYGTSVGEIAQLNRISDNTMISVCTELQIPQLTFTTRQAVPVPQNARPNIPTSYQAPTSYQTRTVAPNTGSSFASRLSASRGTHIATAGETIQSIARYYGYTPERLIEMNSLANNYQPTDGAVIVVSECYFTQGNSGATYTPPSSQPYQPTTYRPTKATKPNPNEYNTSDEVVAQQNNRNNERNTQPRTNPNAPQPAAASYMKSEELSMIDEVNLVRSNPAGYIPYIEDYKRKIQRGEGFGSAAVCDELIAELRNTPPRSVLKPRECLYRAAKNHGEDQRPTGSTDHVGTDGSYPWDRVLRACPELKDGNENLVGGPSTVRESVIILLIDDGIPSRGHRKTMLQKEWQYLACYKIGKVGIMPNSWVQKFAY